MVGREDHRFAGQFRLVDGRNGLGVLWDTRQDPVELWGIDGWHLHHRHPAVRPPMQKLATQRLVEALYGMLGPAVGGLERYASVGESRAHLHDGTVVAWEHALEGAHGAVH